MQKATLQSQIAKYPSLKQQFQRAEQTYNKQIQMALYSDLHEAEQVIPESSIRDDSNNPILLFLQTSKVFTEVFCHKLYLLLIKYFNAFIEGESPFSQISVIVINTTEKGDAYSKLKRIIKHLPLAFIKSIKQIVVFKGEIINKVNITDPFTKYITDMTSQIQNIHQLDRYGLWSVFDFIVAASKSSKIYQNDSKTPNQRQNYFRAANLKSTLSFDLNELMGENKKPKHHDQIESFQLTDFYVPKVIVLLTCLLQQNPENLKLQGLFRKSVGIDDEQEGLKAIDAENYFMIESITNPHLAANLIKKFFYRLDIPLFPFSLYDVIVDQDFSGEGGLYLQAATINKLNLTNYMTLKYIVWFFKQCLLPHEAHNRMSIQNLAIVFAPTLIRSEKPSINTLQQIPKLVFFIKNLIALSDNIFKIVDTLKHIDDIFDANPHVETETKCDLEEEKIDLLIQKDELLQSIYNLPNDQNVINIRKNSNRFSNLDQKQFNNVKNEEKDLGNDPEDTKQQQILNLPIVKQEEFSVVGSYLFQNKQPLQKLETKLQQPTLSILVPQAASISTLIHDNAQNQNQHVPPEIESKGQQKQQKENSEQFQEI